MLNISLVHNTNFQDIQIDTKFSTSIEYPKTSLGFQRYIHANRNEGETHFKQFNNMKHKYLVINKHNINIDDYEQDIFTIGKKKYGDQNTNFYEIIELIQTIPELKQYLDNNKSVSCSCINSDDHLNAVKKYRNNKSDTFYNKSNINKSNIIIIDNTLNWKNKNTQEQEIFKILFENITLALNNMEKHGYCVVKMFETFTRTSIMFMYLCTQLYEKVYIYKPLVSNSHQPDKYLICCNYIHNKKILDSLNKMTIDIKNNKDKNIIHVWETINMHKEYNEWLNKIIKFNIDTTNTMIKTIIIMVEFIDAENYYGDTYQKYRNEQIDASVNWIKQYLS